MRPEWVPGGHAVQVVTAEAPVVLLAVPGGQPVHRVWFFLLLYVPAGHAMHVAGEATRRRGRKAWERKCVS